MTTSPSKISFAVAGASLLAVAVLGSGIFLPKAPLGGRTQVGQYDQIAFEDGSVLEIGESDTDQNIRARRRFQGWQGREYQHAFTMADGEQIDLSAVPASLAKDDSGDLSTGDHLILAAYTREAKASAVLNGQDNVMLATLDVDGKGNAVADAVDGKDRVFTNVIDGKDRYVADGKDAKDAPVFALTTVGQSLGDPQIAMLLMGDLSSDWGSLRTTSSPGFGFTGTGTGGSITTPPIGTAVPEPSALPLLGFAAALGLAGKIWLGRKAADQVA